MLSVAREHRHQYRGTEPIYFNWVRVMQAFLDRLIKTSPIPTMVRATLENLLSPDFINSVFREHAVIQSERQLLFSSIVELMTLVVCRIKPSVHASFVHLKELFSVSAKSVYNKINKVETEVCRQLVVQTAARAKEVIEHLGVLHPSPIPGYEVRILDGNHHPASQRRLKVLRNVAAGPLPGQTLVVYDPLRGLVVDCQPCEDAHKQERAILLDLFERTVQAQSVWIADRNFCTTYFLFELTFQKAFFVVRYHAQLPLEVNSEPVSRGRVSTGELFEQSVIVRGVEDSQLPCRLITIVLDQPTRDGDTQIKILTSLPASVPASVIADGYRSRWKIENVNLQLIKHFDSEQTSLGNPPATLFAFAISLVAFNALSLIQISLQAAHGEKANPENISGYFLALELKGSEYATKIIEDEFWTDSFANLSPRQLANELKRIAKHVDLSKFPKSKRGPKKPPTPRTRFKNKPHVSTFKLLQQENSRKK